VSVGIKAMYLSIKRVKALEDYKLLLEFENNERKIFDVSPYLLF
jgi:hypothetical protein